MVKYGSSTSTHGACDDLRDEFKDRVKVKLPKTQHEPLALDVRRCGACD